MNSAEEYSNHKVLQFEEIATDLYKKLHRLKRTGWLNRGIENPESVKEHTEALIKLVHEISNELSEEERDGLVDMLEVHDWPEAVHGDEVILELNPDDRKKLKDIKFENERKAMQEICKEIVKGEELLNLWIRFETSDDPAAVFGRELDKYQALEKAFEYDSTQGTDFFDEFLTYSINFINNPILLKRIEELKSKQWSSQKET